MEQAPHLSRRTLNPVAATDLAEGTHRDVSGSPRQGHAMQSTATRPGRRTARRYLPRGSDVLPQVGLLVSEATFDHGIRPRRASWAAPEDEAELRNIQMTHMSGSSPGRAATVRLRPTEAFQRILPRLRRRFACHGGIYEGPLHAPRPRRQLNYVCTSYNSSTTSTERSGSSASSSARRRRPVVDVSHEDTVKTTTPLACAGPGAGSSASARAPCPWA